MKVRPCRQCSPTSPITSPCSAGNRELPESKRHGQHLHGRRLHRRLAQLRLHGAPVGIAQALVATGDRVLRHHEPGPLAQARGRAGVHAKAHAADRDAVLVHDRRQPAGVGAAAVAVHLACPGRLGVAAVDLRDQAPRALGRGDAGRLVEGPERAVARATAAVAQYAQVMAREPVCVAVGEVGEDRQPGGVVRHAKKLQRFAVAAFELDRSFHEPQAAPRPGSGREPPRVTK